MLRRRYVAALQIQAAFRGYAARRALAHSLEERTSATLALQAVARGLVTRLAVRRERAAICIQVRPPYLCYERAAALPLSWMFQYQLLLTGCWIC